MFLAAQWVDIIVVLRLPSLIVFFLGFEVLRNYYNLALLNQENLAHNPEMEVEKDPMDLLVFTGFFGSGKTTLLLIVAKALSEQFGKKVAIIENEVGKVGIDDHYLKQKGLVVREIYSGCICCTLQGDLINTLQRLEEEYKPDVVIVEPSGLAGPGQLSRVIRDYGGKPEQNTLVVLIDAERLQNIPINALPMLTDGIEVADLIVINKIDQVRETQLTSLTNRIMEARPDARVVPISALCSTNIDIFLGELIGREDVEKLKKTQEEETIHSYPLDHHLPVVHSKEIELPFNRPVSGDMIVEEVANLIYDLAGRMKEEGSSLIGHLKAIVKTEREGYLLVSTTSFDKQPHEKGELTTNVSKIRITLNAIVYDVEENVVKDLMGEGLSIFSSRVKQRNRKK